MENKTDKKYSIRVDKEWKIPFKLIIMGKITIMSNSWKSISKIPTVKLKVK